MWSRYQVSKIGTLDIMRSFTKFWGEAVVASFLISSTLAGCQAKVEPVKPDAEQQASLNRLYQSCKSAVTTLPSGKLKNLVRHRKKELFFTCDDMKQLCENDYANDRCHGMIIVASIENAFHRVCRSSNQPSACRKLTICNAKGFESAECLSAIKPYNR